MCGIVGYIGKKPGVEVVLAGLEALEYRGYDSAGVAVIDDGQNKVIKQAGRVSGLVKAVVISKFQTPTFVTTSIAPGVPNRSPGPLSTMVIRGFTPSKIDKVAAKQSAGPCNQNFHAVRSGVSGFSNKI